MPGFEHTSITTFEEWRSYASGDAWRHQRRVEREIAGALSSSGRIMLPGFCLVDEAECEFLVDRAFGSSIVDGLPIPNWRERLVCSSCSLYSRQRLVASFLEERITATVRHESSDAAWVYVTEQEGRFYDHLRTLGRHVKCIGSEYFGPHREHLPRVAGLRNENIERLRFADQVFDFIICNDVLEHVPNPVTALRELFRVLKQGGELILTSPFYPYHRESAQRAVRDGDEIRHLMEPEYHRDPRTGPCLVYFDFGWDFVEWMANAGFHAPRIEYAWSRDHGHLGTGNFIFHGRRA